jgi:hypothetical protein
MPKRRFNQLKLAVLACLAEREWMRPALLSELCDLRPACSMSSYCERLRRWRLVHRRYHGPGTLAYRISDRGRARLQWLRRRTRPGAH